MEIIIVLANWADPPGILVAGMMGGLTRWMTLRESLVDGITSVIVGAISARYLHRFIAPLIEGHALGLTFGDVSVEAAGYLAGLTGVSISGLIIGFMQKAQKERRNDA